MAKLNMRLLAAAIAAIVFPALTLTAAPAIEVTSSGLRATGMTRGADAIWFGATIDTLASTPLLRRHVRVVADDDRDGATVYELQKISRYAFVIAVDSETAEYALYKGAGVDGTELELPANQWRAGLDQLDVADVDLLHVLLVRPGAGAWTLSALDGGPTDADGARDASFRLKVKDMLPIRGEAKPQGSVRRGDLLVLLDPQTLAYVIRPAAE